MPPPVADCGGGRGGERDAASTCATQAPLFRTPHIEAAVADWIKHQASPEEAARAMRRVQCAAAAAGARPCSKCAARAAAATDARHATTACP